jgi:methyl-accepting chemotaxis protein
MKFSLRAKISVVAVIPIIGFLGMVGLQLKESFKQIQIAQQMSKNALVFHSTSKLIHELQKERGLSVGFINKGITLEVLKSQTSKVNAMMEEFKSAIVANNFESNSRQETLTSLGQISDLRLKIESQTLVAGDVFKAFTGIIKNCLLMQKESVNIEDTKGLLSRSRSLLVLEAAKEEAGQLRATLTGIITANKALQDEQIYKVTSFLGSVPAHLNSPSAVFLETTRKGISDFNGSENWLSVKQTASLVLRQSNVGNFGLSATDFFATITKSIDQIAQLISNEGAALVDSVKQVTAQAWNEAYFLGGISFGLLIIISILVGIIIRGVTLPIRLTIKTLNQSSEDVQLASDQLKNASDQIATASTEAAASLEETVASLEELSSMVKVNSSNSQMASQLSLECQKVAEVGEQEILQLIKAIHEMSKSSSRIQEIVSVIDDVAFQTNLLALNAAVEAARAGEQGKGFAVVAEAVRNLAQRSAEQAKSISSLINESTEKVARSSMIAQQSEKALMEIVASIKKMASLNLEISEASKEQSTGIAQISTAMNQLDQTSQMTAGSSEESASSAQYLSNQARSLKGQVDQLSRLVEG